MNVAELYAPPSITESETEARAPIAGSIPFTVGDVIRQAWRSYRPQAVRLSLLTALGYGLSTAVGAACGFLGGMVSGGLANPLVGLAVGTAVPQILSFVFSTWISIGMLRLSLAAARQKPVTAALLFSGGDALWPMIGSSLIVAFLVLCGLITLIVPGIVLAFALSNTTWLVADKRAGAYESVLLSQRTTRGKRAQLFALGLGCGLVLLLGFLSLGVGLLVAYPVAWLAMAHAYLHMIGEPS